MAIKVSNTTVIDNSRNLTNVGTVAAAGDVTLSSTGHLKVPVGTEAQRTGSPAAGMFRYNSTSGAFEGYTNEWGSIGGGGQEAGGAIHTNTGTASETYVFPAGTNGFSVGPITVNNGVSVTVAAGQRWVVI